MGRGGGVRAGWEGWGGGWGGGSRRQAPGLTALLKLPTGHSTRAPGPHPTHLEGSGVHGLVLLLDQLLVAVRQPTHFSDAGSDKGGAPQPAELPEHSLQLPCGTGEGARGTQGGLRARWSCGSSHVRAWRENPTAPAHPFRTFTADASCAACRLAISGSNPLYTDWAARARLERMLWCGVDAWVLGGGGKGEGKGRRGARGSDGSGNMSTSPSNDAGGPKKREGRRLNSAAPGTHT